MSSTWSEAVAGGAPRPEWTTILDSQLLQLRLPLQLGIDHVNAYAARSSRGDWLLVDCGLGDDATLAVWRSALDSLDAPVSAIVITHSHPDHAGAAERLADLAHAPVLQSAPDAAMARALWQSPTAVDDLAADLLELGMSPEAVQAVCTYQRDVSALVALPAETTIIAPGDELGGWTVHALPGHAPGQIGLLRDGVLVGGDAVLAQVTPHVCADRNSAADPLHDFRQSLQVVARIASVLVAPGHFGVIRDARTRAAEIEKHHVDRLARVQELATEFPDASTWELSTRLFGDISSPPLQRFAVFETLAHLVHLDIRTAVRNSGAPSVR